MGPIAAARVLGGRQGGFVPGGPGSGFLAAVLGLAGPGAFSSDRGGGRPGRFPSQHWHWLEFVDLECLGRAGPPVASKSGVEGVGGSGWGQQ